jgi:hypothetical protein
MPVVRISLGRFDAANYDPVRNLLDDSHLRFRAPCDFN